MKLLDATKLEKWISENQKFTLETCSDVISVHAIREFFLDHLVYSCGETEELKPFFRCCQKCNAAVVSFEKNCHECGAELYAVPVDSMLHGSHAIIPRGQIFDKSKYPELSPLPKYEPRKVPNLHGYFLSPNPVEAKKAIAFPGV